MYIDLEANTDAISGILRQFTDLLLHYGTKIDVYVFCRQAQDIKVFYERKLEQTNNLYMELSACMLQLEQRERDLAR